LPVSGGGAGFGVGRAVIKENMHWLAVEDYRFKTFTDVRDCRKLRKAANKAAE
jgi:tRNA G10  N-methylase Trm11